MSSSVWRWHLVFFCLLSLFHCPASSQTSHPIRTWRFLQIFQIARSLHTSRVNHNLVSMWARHGKRGGGIGGELETVNLSLVLSVVEPSLLSFSCVRIEPILAFVVREPAEAPPPRSLFTGRSGRWELAGRSTFTAMCFWGERDGSQLLVQRRVHFWLIWHKECSSILGSPLTHACLRVLNSKVCLSWVGDGQYQERSVLVARIRGAHHSGVPPSYLHEMLWFQQGGGGYRWNSAHFGAGDLA